MSGFSRLIFAALLAVVLLGFAASRQTWAQNASQDFTLDLLALGLQLDEQLKAADLAARADAAALLAAQQSQQRAIWWLGGAGLLLLVITLGGGGAAGYLAWQQNRRQAQQQAENLLQALHKLEHSLVRLQRPFLVMEPAGLANLGPYIPVSGQFILRNRGASPALQLQQSAALKVLPYPITEHFAFTEEEEWPYTTLPAIGPGASLASQAPGGPFPPEMLAGLIEGRQNRLYLVGSVAYQDVLGNSYRSDFCHALKFEQPAELAQAIRDEQMVNYTASFERAALHNEDV